MHERRSLRSPTGRFIAERGDSERVHAPLISTMEKQDYHGLTYVSPICLLGRAEPIG